MQHRLADILFMARRGIARESLLHLREMVFSLKLPVAGNEAGVVCGGSDDYAVRMVSHGDAGEPVLTLSSVDREIDLTLGFVVMTEGALDALMTARVSSTPFSSVTRSARACGDCSTGTSGAWTTERLTVFSAACWKRKGSTPTGFSQL